MTKKFGRKTAAAIIELPDNIILLIKRGTTVFRGYWALLEGKVEPEETVEEEVIREVKEETGSNVSIIKKIGEYREKGENNGIEYDYYTTCLLVKPEKGKIKRQKQEIEKIKLFKINKIPEKLEFKHSTIIQDYIKTKKI